MEAGDYIGVIRCEDIKYEKSFLFTLHEEGYRKENGIASPSVDSELSGRPYATEDTNLVFPTGTRRTRSATPYSTEAPEATAKSSGFGPLFYIISLAFISFAALYVKRR